jgi:hypothetical protein
MDNDFSMPLMDDDIDEQMLDVELFGMIYTFIEKDNK